MELKKKKTIILIFIAIVLLIFVFLFINLFSDEEVNESNNDNITDKYVYNFGQTLDLEEEKGLEEYIDIGTDYPSLGVIDEYTSENTYIGQDGSEIIMETFDGHITIYPEWQEDGCAREVEEPEFGTLEKFILDGNSISVRYNDVTIKDVSKYIKTLSDLGYTDVRLDNVNKKKDYYYFNAQKSNGVSVTITYDNGVMCMDVND